MYQRNIPNDGWSKEGGAWFNSLDWEDAQFLLTTQRGEPLTAGDQERLNRLSDSYASATGETWALVPGEYVFRCLECDGEGSIEVVIGEDETVWETCSDCGGTGEQILDEEEAAERIDCGHAPLRTPSP